MRRYVLPGDAVFPEGITEGPGTTFFVGSLGDGTIYRGDAASGDAASGEAGLFLPPDGDGRRAIAGLDIDRHDRLIACDILEDGTASPVDLGGYDFNADGMLADGDVLYGVTNRGQTHEDAVFSISVARLAPDWRSGVILGELTDQAWDTPTTIARADGQLLVVCSQLRARHTGVAPRLPFEVVGTDFPSWD